MRERSLTDIERLFDNLLEDPATEKLNITQSPVHHAADDPDLAASLGLAHELRQVSAEAAEIDAARARVWQTIEPAVYNDDNRSTASQYSRSPVTHRQKTTWLVAALCAAMLALTLASTWTLTAASASALPGSPLYALKRADETFQLRLAWSSQVRSEVLARIALHRLTEARAEADQHDTSQALELVRESDTATQELISLVVAAHRQNQIDAVTDNALATTLRAESVALQQAHNDGQTLLAQALTTAVAVQQQALVDSDLDVPALGAPDPVTPTAPSHPAHVPHAQKTPDSSGTNGTGSSSGKAIGNGNGMGEGTGNGKGNRK
jgi:hypothetical protein